MGIQSFDQGQQARIGKMAGEIIGHAMATEVLSTAIKSMDMPQNKSDTIICRSWVPYGGTAANPNQFFATQNGGDVTQSYVGAHITQEGITPAADTIVPRDVTMVLNQYMALYSLTDKESDLFEDDISEAMKEQTGERMGLVREMAIYGKMKGCTNRGYAGAGVGVSSTTVASRSLVAGSLQERHIAKIIRSLQANHAGMITRVLSPSQNVATKAVEAGYVCYCHTDLEYDIRQLPGFIPVAQYGVRQTINDYELGTYQKVRFIISPELQPYLGAGVAVGATGMQSVGGANVDVYPIIFTAKDCFSQVKLRGKNAIDPIYIPVGQKDKNDPGGQRGYIGAKFWHASEVLNPGWMFVFETGVTQL